ncbi:MAG: SAM-dependent methyltransferase [Pseudomonadales bacterium]|nr:SAM-dependent methyltransferase [Pseudomonadales bacterium]
MKQAKIVIAYNNIEPNSAELSLQQTLDLPLCHLQEAPQFNAHFILYYEDSALSLQSTAKIAPGPLSVDFTQLQRRASDALFKQNLLKAAGVGKGKRPTILDATAGLGTDSFLFTIAGCFVMALEQNPIVFALLSDGIERYVQLGKTQADALSALEIRHENFLQPDIQIEQVQVVYLDPMFPAKSNSAQAKKGMTYLQDVVGKNANGEALFAEAEAIAIERIVVKRAKNSPFISDREPNLSFKGSSSRFDVYLLN